MGTPSQSYGTSLLPYGITQCYLPPDTSEHVPPNPSHADWYSIYLPRRDGRLSWPSWLAPASGLRGGGRITHSGKILYYVCIVTLSLYICQIWPIDWLSSLCKWRQRLTSNNAERLANAENSITFVLSVEKHFLKQHWHLLQAQQQQQK